MHRLLVYAGAGALIALAGLRSTYLSRAVPAVGSSVAEPPTKVRTISLIERCCSK
jgi:hypothetical protein